MASSAGGKRDPNTNSNYDKFRTRHTAVHFELDFARKLLSGNVELHMETMSEAEELVLDTSYLDVKKVTVDAKESKWELKPRAEPYGSPLHIAVGRRTPGDTFKVLMQIQTTDKCTALQWLSPEQTSNKKHPYFFSQCQAIHARSVLPCQDTPDVKSTFSFNIRSPLQVLASGVSTGTRDFRHGADGQSGTLLYTFDQPIPIPSYLFALASGDLASASIGPRSLVYTGPEELSACKWEFEEDMEKFLAAAEKILNPVLYAWTTYHALVLPPSFPYGGMENPQASFLTPSLISGDRENIDVVAHELAHSWSGNLVSNCSWEHFWLNEGWTVYLERRIQAELHGEAHRSFGAIIGWKALSDSIKSFGEDHEFTKLVVDLKGKDPDDAFSSIPYEKGFTFLYHLETLVGKDKFDRFIPHYFGRFARKSLDSFEFRDCITSFFANDAEAAAKLKELDWDTWYYKPGFPPKPDFDTSMVDACYALADRWERRAAGGEQFQPSKADIEGLTANQLVVFLERCEELETALRTEDTQAMGAAYHFADSRNVEVSVRFLRVALKAGDRTVFDATARVLGDVGRMKFVRPLYAALSKLDHDFAVKTFEKNEAFYHPICAQMVRKSLFPQS